MTIAKRLIILLAVPLLALVGLGVFTRLQLSQDRDPQPVCGGNTDSEPRGAGGPLPDRSRSCGCTCAAICWQPTRRNRPKPGRPLMQAKRSCNRLLGPIRGQLDLRRAGSPAVQRIPGFEPGVDRQRQAGHGAGRRGAPGSGGGPARRIVGGTRWAPQQGVERVDPAQRRTGDHRRQERPLMLSGSRGGKCWSPTPRPSSLTGLLGFLTFRRIVNPIRALEASVKAIAGGDYAKEVPFTKATDETGGLARSIDVLKQGAAAMDEQRWVKSNASKLTGELQGAASLRRVRAAARFRPGAHAGRRRRGLLSVRGEPGASSADRRLRPRRSRRLRGLVPLGRGPGRPVRAGAQGCHAGPICRRTICGSPPASGRQPRSRRWRRRCCPRTRCWGCSRSPRSARSTHRRRPCSRNCCRWWR